MMNAMQWATEIVGRNMGRPVIADTILASDISDLMRDVITECQNIAKQMLQSPRSEVLKIGPDEAKIMTAADVWVKFGLALIQKLEVLKGAQ